MDPSSADESSVMLLHVFSSLIFHSCIVLYGTTPCLVFIHSTVDGYVLFCKLAPLQGGRGEMEERGSSP